MNFSLLPAMEFGMFKPLRGLVFMLCNCTSELSVYCTLYRNSKSSQEVVDFVHKRLAEGTHEPKDLAAICEAVSCVIIVEQLSLCSSVL